MTNWIIAGSGKSCSLEDIEGSVIASGLSLDTAQSLLAAAQRLVDEKTRGQLPVSDDGNFVFLDGPGEVELDHRGTMRKALENIALRSAGAAGIAYEALLRTGPGYTPEVPALPDHLSLPELIALLKDARLYLGGCNLLETAGGIKNNALRDRIDAAFPLLLEEAAD